MATATVPSALTKAEIRRILAKQLEENFDPSQPNSVGGTLREVARYVAEPFVDSAARTLEAGGASAWEPLDDTAGPRAVWEDMRPSQAILLMDRIEDAVGRVHERCEPIILDELAAAIELFATETPDLRRVTGK